MAFQKGQSGNPRGKKPGTRNRATLAALELMEGDQQAITRVCVEKARAGDLQACKLVLDKLIPNRRERVVDLKLPQMAGAAAVPQALATIIEALAQGEITPGEAHSVAAMLEIYRKSLETTEVLARIAALEEKINKLA